ncbi:hypothetical protein GUJ93_ZPchr0008g11440 [Zizania palustris]|uniref:Exportin-5 C-terminal domain-containing protein n=1 Tax=Zizania palustris TaxID=103762 RepID=A0A8J5RU20_ZIZPA|nr:hypothetical protein GUJ93_ZPchr0008g11440 [Zizania palustris]
MGGALPIKSGDVRALASTSFLLVQKHQASEIRLHGFKMLQVLLSLPHMKQDDLLSFDETLSKTASPKEQKTHMRSLLLLASGNKMRALVRQKANNVVTNVTTRNRGSAAHHGPGSDF